jgi:alpha-ribazole phosphatase
VTSLWWVRHGPTHAKAMVGWTDLPADLSDADAISKLCAFLPSDAILVSSDLLRARQTADALGMGRSRLPHDPDLREIHFGAWEMRNFAEIEAVAPDHIRDFWDSPGDVSPPDGESWNQLCARVMAASGRLVAAHPDRNIIVVAHFGAILAALQQSLRIPAKTAFGYRIDNLSVTRIDIADDGHKVGPINHIP